MIHHGSSNIWWIRNHKIDLLFKIERMERTAEIPMHQCDSIANPQPLNVDLCDLKRIHRHITGPHLRLKRFCKTHGNRPRARPNIKSHGRQHTFSSLKKSYGHLNHLFRFRSWDQNSFINNQIVIHKRRFANQVLKRNVTRSLSNEPTVCFFFPIRQYPLIPHEKSRGPINTEAMIEKMSGISTGVVDAILREHADGPPQALINCHQ